MFLFIFTTFHRYESLDNLDILHQASDSAATFTYPRPNSAAAVYNYQSRNASTRYSTGSISFQRNANMESSHHARYTIHVDAFSNFFCVCARVFLNLLPTWLPYTVNMWRPRMISGRRTCCMCERALGSGAAMVIDALSLCFHLTCFQVRGHDLVRVWS